MVPGCDGAVTDPETHAFAVVNGVVVNGGGLGVAGAQVTLHVFGSPSCDGDSESFRSGPSSAAGRFHFYPAYYFSEALEGCIIIWAVHAATATASDSVEIPIDFRLTLPLDSAFIELTLAP